MLAIVSDLHLQHVSDDAVRYRKDDTIREATVRRNVSADALRRFLRVVQANSQRHESDGVELVFAGDIFEIHRTPLWLYDCHRLRPTARDLGDPADAPGDNRLLARVLEILDRIESDNAEFFRVLSAFVEKGTVSRGNTSWRLKGRGAVRVHYLPGNHDRLVNAWEATRTRARGLLAMDPSADPFPYRLHDPIGGATYGVRVRHGHEYDAANFSLPVDDGTSLDAGMADYLRPVFGDFLTVDFATRLATAFRARYAEELRGADDTFRRLYLALTEFDDVRPAVLAPDYLSLAVGGTGDTDRVFGILRPVLRDAVDTALSDRFFEDEAARLGYGGWLEETLLGIGVKHLDGDGLAKLMGKLVGKSGGGGPASVARHEPVPADHVVIAGHTHHPEQVPLPDGGTYVDTGTWRTILPFGEDAFGRLRAYTMVFCYDDSERSRSDGRRFETWTGTLLEASYGPVDRELEEQPATPPGPAQLLQPIHLEVLEVDEWRSELDLHLGVDGVGRHVAKEGVGDGATIDLLGEAAIPLDPRLDGELWFHGREVDTDSALDLHDPLPWLIRRLPRLRNGRFRNGRDRVRIRGAGPFRFRLTYRIHDEGAP